MTSEFASLPEEKTVADAVALLRGLADDFESVRYLYLTDENNRLSGVVTLNQIIVSSPDTKLTCICTEEVIVASPEDDQEDVAEKIAKYNLLAMPVVADDGHMLGIVTVDDALDVLEEEHAEDLQIAGGAPADDDSSRGGDLVWILRRNAWFFLWIAGAAALAVVLPMVGVDCSSVLLTCAALPVALVVADDSISYVTNFFLQNDPDDDDAPSVLGFTVKSIGIGVVLAAVAVLAALMLDSVVRAGSPEALRAVSTGFTAAAAAILLSFILSPAYLAFLRKRDENNQDVSGFALSMCAMLIALAVFVAIVVSKAVVF